MYVYIGTDNAWIYSRSADRRQLVRTHILGHSQCQLIGITGNRPESLVRRRPDWRDTPNTLKYRGAADFSINPVNLSSPNQPDKLIAVPLHHSLPTSSGLEWI